jgi:predicted RNase H-like HicB family nuclease
MKYTIVIEPAEEGGFTAYVPALRGCVAEGETEAEVLENIKEAIRDYIEVLEEITKGKRTFEIEVAA